MTPEEAIVLELRERVTVDVCERIRSDAARVPWPYRGILEEIERRLFEPDLRLLEVYRKLKLRDAAIGSKFAGHVGLTPSEYLTECRMEAAVAMLGAEPRCSVEQVALAVGYSAPSAFIVAFRGAFGRTPGTLREQLAAAAELGIDLTPRFFRQTYWWQARQGDDLPAELWSHCETLRLGDYDGRPMVSLRAASTEAIEKAVADDVAILAAAEPDRYLTDLGLDGFRFTTPALFERLLTLSRELGRKNREQGVRMAETALASLGQLRRALPERELAGLEARGWAWLGNARRLALDIAGAEAAFMRAEGLLILATETSVEAEVLYLKTGLLLFESRLEEALDLSMKVAALSRLVSENDLWNRARLDSAVILRRQGKTSAAIELLSQIISSNPRSPGNIVLLAATNSLSLAYLDAGRLESAWESWRSALAILGEQELCSAHLHTKWIEGMLWDAEDVPEKAVSAFETARRGFLAGGDKGYAALLALHLAEVHLKAGSFVEVRDLALEALVVFDAMARSDEVIAASVLLRDSLAEDALSPSLLRQVRELMRWQVEL